MSVEPQSFILGGKAAATLSRLTGFPWERWGLEDRVKSAGVEGSTSDSSRSRCPSGPDKLKEAHGRARHFSEVQEGEETKLAPDVQEASHVQLPRTIRLSTRAMMRRRRRWSTTCAIYGIEIVWYKAVKKYAILFKAVQDVWF